MTSAALAAEGTTPLPRTCTWQTIHWSESGGVQWPSATRVVLALCFEHQVLPSMLEVKHGDRRRGGEVRRGPVH